MFVASPSDLAEERERLRQVVEELNLTWSSFLSVHLELVRWETHGVPGFGADAQDVLNAEFADDFEIFVGILWRKFGTPTGRAGSGTEEEFNRAHVRWMQDRTTVSIMFYFRSTLQEEGQVPSQADLVRDFQTRLGKMGGLWWEYRNLDEFSALLRIHLSRQVQKRIRTSGSWPAPALKENRAVYEMHHGRYGDAPMWGQDAELLRQIIIYREASDSLTEIYTGIKDIFEDMGAAFSTRLRTLDEIGHDSQQIMERAGDLIREIMLDYETLAARLSPVLPRLGSTFGEVLTGLSRIAPLMLANSPAGHATANGIRVGLLGLIDVLDRTTETAAKYGKVIGLAPGVIPELGPSSQAARLAVETLRYETVRAHALAREAYEAFGGNA